MNGRENSEVITLTLTCETVVLRFVAVTDLVGGQKSPSGPSPPPNIMQHPHPQSKLFSQLNRFDLGGAQSMQQV